MPIIASVTGASGMIGSRIVNKLLARGCVVRVLVRGNYENPAVQQFRADLSDEHSLENFISGADMVFHCAAETKSASKMREVNVLGTEKIWKTISRHPVKYFCHLSSAGVVGNTSQTLVDESTACNPQNIYESTKFEAETIAARPIDGCSTLILRPTNVVDKDHLGELSLPLRGSFTCRIKAFLKGGECAHIVHADDVAEAAIYFSERPSANPRVFFVSLDHDPLNSVASLWSICRSIMKGQTENITPALHLPAVVPHLLRRIAGKRTNRGTVRYSSKKLLAEGFTFSYGVSTAVRKIMLDRALYKATQDERLPHAHP